MGYLKEAIRGVTWMSSYRVVFRAVGIARLAVIARLLTPFGLGIFGVVTISLAFLEIITETGINVFLIQEKEDIDGYINSAWLISIVRGLLISALMFFAAGPISNFFNSTESKNLLQIASLIPLIRGFINPSIVKFQKNLQFNKEFFYRISVYLIEALISISFVIVTGSPMGLVLGLVAGCVFEVGFTFFAVSPRPVFEYNIIKIKKIISRGKWVTLFGIFDYLYTQADNIIVGRILGVAPLGIYQNAYKISTAPLTEVGDVFFKVTFPVFSKIQAEKKRLKKAFIKNTLVNAGLMIPFGFLLYFFAEPVVGIIFGPGWEAAIPVVRLLAILGVVRGVAGSTNSLLVAKEKQKYSAIVTMISALGLLASIVPFINSYGILGAGMAAIFGTAVSLPFTIYFINRTLKA